MLAKLLHSLVSRPSVYDAVQRAAGADVMLRRAANLVPRLQPGARVLDLGGGTGTLRGIWPADSRYVCLDLDPLKLAGFRAKHAGDAILADATMIPITSAAIDAVTCTHVSHHLSDVLIERLLSEAERILRPGGFFFFVDAVWQPRRLAGRLLWRYDRGSYPRPPERLRGLLSHRLEIRSWDSMTLWHEYVLCLAQRRGAADVQPKRPPHSP